MSKALQKLLAERSVIVCVGSGGVGKTSVAAALSVAAARQGRKVLALTVDPARRLADSLGVELESGARQTPAPDKLAALGVEPGKLEVQMLDPAQTWDELVSRLAPTEAVQQRILANPLYQNLKEHLAGAQEYMAMEKLLSLLIEGAQDLIVLDTPPSRHALDFLEAPERLIDAVDTPVTRAFAKAVDGSRRFGLDLAARGATAVIRTMSRLTGVGMLEQVALLIAELNHIFGGFRERAERISKAFREPDFAYVLITRPDRRAVFDTKYFSEALRKQQMSLDALIVNRVQSEPGPSPSDQERDIAIDDGLWQALLQARAEILELTQVEQETIQELSQAACVSAQQQILLPALPGGIVQEQQLGQLAELMLDSA